MQFEADIEKNRLYMKLEGFYTEDKIKEAYDLVLKEAEKLKDGYAVINDMAQLRVTTEGASKYLEKMSEYAKSRDVKVVVRIVGNKLSKMQLDNLTGSKYWVKEVATLEEAHQYLDENDR